MSACKPHRAQQRARSPFSSCTPLVEQPDESLLSTSSGCYCTSCKSHNRGLHLGPAVWVSFLAEGAFQMLDLHKNPHIPKTKDRQLCSLFPNLSCPHTCHCPASSDSRSNRADPRGSDPFGSRQGSQRTVPPILNNTTIFNLVFR